MRRLGSEPALPTPVADSGRPAEDMLWRVNRLRSMSRREIPFRAGEQLKRQMGRTVSTAPQESPRRRAIGLADLVLESFSQNGTRRFWEDCARDVSRGVITVFGARWPATSTDVPDWRRDPMTGHVWPNDYCFDVPLRAADAPDTEVKYVWEVNRLQYLLPVAAMAAVDQDTRLADLCSRHVTAWVEENPPRRGVSWRSGIELATRIVSMVVILELLATGGNGKEDLERTVSLSIAEQLEWIRRFPSRYSSANNHRVAELAGVLVVGAAYQDLVQEKEMRECWAELQELVPVLLHQDGVPAEQATGYAALVLEWLVVAVVAGGKRGLRLSSTSRSRACAAAQFLRDITDCGGNTVRIGDDDESRLLTASRPSEQHVATVVAMTQRVVGVDLRAARTGLTTFAQGGYTVVRDETSGHEVLWVLDHGELGFGSLAAHAHADTLAVYLHHAGRPIFVDAGTYLYHGAGEWRRHLRSTALHNTIAIGGGDSSVMTGPFNWHPTLRAEGRLITAQSSADCWTVQAECGGLAGARSATHQRTLAAHGPARFRLTDRLVGVAAADVRWSLVLAPDLRAQEVPRGWVVNRADVPLLRIEVPSGWGRAIARGWTNPVSGWCSTAFGQIEATDQLLLEGRLGAGAELDVDIVLLDAPASRRLMEGQS